MAADLVAGQQSADLSSVQAGADARLTSLLSATEVSPEPIVQGSSAEPIPDRPPSSDPGSTPGTTPPSPPPGSTPAAVGQPGTGVPQPPVVAPSTLQIEVSKLDPAARKFLDHYKNPDGSYSIDRVLGEALRNGNLIAELSRRGQMPGPVAPPTPPIQISPQEVEQKAFGLLDQNPALVALVTEHGAITQRLAAIAPARPTMGRPAGPERAALLDKLQANTLRLSIDEIKADPLKVQDLRQEAFELRQQLMGLDQEFANLNMQGQDISGKYQRAFENARDFVKGELTRVQTAQAREAEFNQTVDDNAVQVVQVWPGAVERAVKESQIPPDLVENYVDPATGQGRMGFKTFAKINARAFIDEHGSIDDLEGFVREQGQAFANLIDAGHRAKSGQYSTQAIQRAAANAGNGTLVPPVAQPVAQSSPRPQSVDPLVEVQRKVNERWEELRHAVR